jgi:replicative DNA helicase
MQQSKFNNKQIVINKSLPHNFLAERMILSCLLVNSEAIEITVKTLPVDAFYFKNHQEIYKIIIFMTKNKVPIDVLTVTTCLQNNGLLQKMGGLKVLIELISQIPNIVYFEEYLSLVKDKFLRRLLIKLGYEIVNSAYLINIPLETIISDFENKLLNLTNETKPQNLLTSAELLNDIFFDLKEKSLNPGLSGLSSGFYDLDSFTQGFQKSDLIILAGRPSTGKTAFGLNIGLNLVKRFKLPVLFFSFEMSKEQMIYRLLSMETNISQIRLKSGKLNQDDWLKINKMIKMLSKFPFFIDDTSNLSVQDIRSKIKSVYFEQNKIGLVIIDYLQLIQNSKEKNENRVQELSQITRSLKAIAREFNIPIIALSQLNRGVENRVDQKPILSDLRESGSIEQDADLVLMLYNNPSNNLKSSASDDSKFHLIELIIAKQRNGPIGMVNLNFDKTRTKFFSLET